MGATDFATIGFGKDARDAYNNAVREAEHRFGHDPYNGTISTCEPPKKVIQVHMRSLKKEIDRQLDIAEKWECVAIELKGEVLAREKAKAGLKGTHKKGFVFVGLAAC